MDARVFMGVFNIETGRYKRPVILFFGFYFDENYKLKNFNIDLKGTLFFNIYCKFVTGGKNYDI
jgi:hypothetical protein